MMIEWGYGEYLFSLSQGQEMDSETELNVDNVLKALPLN